MSTVMGEGGGPILTTARLRLRSGARKTSPPLPR